MEDAHKRELLRYLVSVLLEERASSTGVQASEPMPSDIDGLWTMFRGLVNTRPPRAASPAFLEAQDELLQALAQEKGIQGPADAEPSADDSRIRLWRGDITAFAADAIVNAANSRLLGCWVPGHFCIDNAIHTYAGVQLRLECARLMDEQGHPEPTGSAKMTPAYNLPARSIIHTVGPIAAGRVTESQRVQLAKCYTSCLELAAQSELESICFCCISTGAFGFPQGQAAEIAVQTVRNWLATRESGMTVVFDVFGEKDEALYQRGLGIG